MLRYEECTGYIKIFETNEGCWVKESRFLRYETIDTPKADVANDWLIGITHTQLEDELTIGNLPIFSSNLNQ